ncbi:MAG: nitrite/sulfite reductase [Gammaproteobacteria bacterium]|nr:nitrite/sulfite reductase [Gammaproteobacteria bacterium]
MYQYNPVDQQLIDQRVTEFRDQTRRFLGGELTDEQFRPLRLMNGLYLQRHAPMLRVAIPYGLLSSAQLHKLAQISRDYDRGYGHFTTRQNIQFNWPELERVPDLLGELAEVQMHAIQTSGNCIRNVTSDPLAGVAADEIEDPRPWCEIIRQWATLHPEFAYLPRKFKIAVTGASHDRAATQLHDIGLEVVQGESGQSGFRVRVGGGLGRTPVVAEPLREFLDQRDLLSYCEAILRVYNRYGRRDNKYKSRIKILVRTMGIEAFRERVEREWAQIRDGELRLSEARISEMKSHFAAPEYQFFSGEALLEVERRLMADVDFGRWQRQNVLAHRQPGYSIVVVSLKKTGVAPGDLTADQMDAVAELAARYSFGQLRTTHDQNLVLADVPQTGLYALWQALSALGLATPNIGTLTDLICCPGLDFCSLANARSIPLAADIAERFDSLDFLYDLGEIQLKLSGCMNGCGHHTVGHIGILGVDKKGEEWYQITLGGRADNQAALGQRIGPSLPLDRVVDAVDDILQVYLQAREEQERLIDTVARIGVEPFKERVYAHH